MDERQAQIKEGAGLEESRVNQDLVDFLNKWSFPVLLIIAIVSGGYFVYNRFEQSKLAKRDAAFGELGNVESSPTPSVFALTSIADEYEGVGRVTELALLRAADLYLGAVRSGMKLDEPEVVLSEEDVAFYTDKARSLYQRVADRVAGNDDLTLYAVNAAFGLAATAETAGDLDLAREQYAKAESLATSSGYTSLATVAKELGAAVGTGTEARLYERDVLPRMPYEPEAPPQPLEATIDVIEDGAAGPELPAELPGESPAEAPAAEGDGSQPTPEPESPEPEDG